MCVCVHEVFVSMYMCMLYNCHDSYNTVRSKLTLFVHCFLFSTILMLKIIIITCLVLFKVVIYNETCIIVKSQL